MNEQELLCAVAENDISRIGQLLAEFPVKDYPSQYGIALCMSARRGEESITSLLLGAGCSASVKDTSDTMWFRKPVHHAAAKGHLSVVERLIENDADVNSVDNERKTPLHWAATEGHLPVAKYLIQNGAAVNVVQNDGFTALHAATCLGHWCMCGYLLSQGAEINRADRDGWTPLHAAACYGHLNIIDLYLNYGASVNKKTTLEETPLHIAVCPGKVAIMNRLVMANADLESKDMKGNTPMFDSVWRNRFEACQYLIDMGSDVNTTYNIGQSVLGIAGIRTWDHFVRLLLDAGCNVQKEIWLENFQIPTKLCTDSKNDLWLDELKYLTKNPRNLQQLCRLCIRNKLGQRKNNKALSLPIPQRLQQYLQIGNV